MNKKDQDDQPIIKMKFLKPGDIWTLAIIANVLFTLDMPFKKVRDILTVKDNPVQLNKNKDKNIRRLLEQMLAADP